jgi:hypothetical protein
MAVVEIKHSNQVQLALHRPDCRDVGHPRSVWLGNLELTLQSIRCHGLFMDAVGGAPKATPLSAFHTALTHQAAG